MPQLRTKQELANIARGFAVGYKIVEFRGKLYMPVDFETLEPKPKDADRTVWVHIDDKKLLGISNILLHIIFANESESRSFKFMVRQWAIQEHKSSGILVRTKDMTLTRLNGAGELMEVTGEFVANYFNVPYDDSNPLVEECFKVIADWVGGEAQAHSLLYHLATALQTEWSAVKYVLLIGEGRNGKGTLLTMILKLFGDMNISGITRQQMANVRPVIRQVNGMLLNVVMDGPREYLKDSSTEKTIVAGERIFIELKYENEPVEVQTNALFIEGLNTEPQVGDKSPALQKRLARFSFDNVYVKDFAFEDKMQAPEMLAAFMKLLLDHWVQRDEVGEKLALTAESLDMQMEAVWSASPVLRYLEYMVPRDTEFIDKLESKQVEVNEFLLGYRDWLGSNGYKNIEDDYVLSQLKNNFIMERKTRRINGRPTTRRYITGITPDTQNAINTLKDSGPLEPTQESAIKVLLDLEED